MSSEVQRLYFAVPHIHVGVIEIEPLHFAGHISSADHGDRLAIDFEEIVIHRQVPAGAQKIGIANPEARTVHVAGFAALERSEEHTSELQSRLHLVCPPLLEKTPAPAGRSPG